MLVWCLLPLALAIAAPLPQAPPPATLTRIQAALDVMGGKGVTGKYRLMTHVNVHATGSDEPEDTVEVTEVTINPDGSKTTRLISAMEDGRDVTAARITRGKGIDREATESTDRGNHAKRDRSDVSGPGEIDLELLPIGANASRYVYGPVREKDHLLIADFRPGKIRKDEDKEELGKGQVAWDPISGEPAWIEVTMAKKPIVISELIIRFEFARSGSLLYPSLVHTSTRSGIPLLFHLRLKLDMEMTEVHLVPAPAVSSGEAVTP
jgi:hypothetical protein